MALKIKKTTMLTRKFQLGFCGDWVEIYERTPHPKHAGAFFLAFRKRFGRKVLPLFWGITAGGARVMTEISKCAVIIRQNFACSSQASSPTNSYRSRSGKPSRKWMTCAAFGLVASAPRPFFDLKKNLPLKPKTGSTARFFLCPIFF